MSTVRRSPRWKDRALSAEGKVIHLQAQIKALKAYLGRKAVVMPLPIKREPTGPEAA